MKTIGSICLILVGVGLALGAESKSEPAHEIATTWGATSIDTELPWAYTTMPTPPFEGTPDHWLVGFSFAKGSTALDREARGSMKSTAGDLVEGGDVSDLSELRLLVLGFADGVSEKPRAEALGLKRAEAARDALVKLGFRRENIQMASFGSRYATATRQEPLRQEYDREVEIWVLR